MQYWYSAQLRQYRLQFIRAFSNFSVKTGLGGPNGTAEMIRVPCLYGDPTRIVASIVRGNSENKVLSVPMITCFISNLNMNASRRQDPQLVQPVQINERKYDEETGRYTNEIGNRYTVERYMPVPYDLTMQVDIWTNNLDIKEQLIEQILVLYNPAVDVQTSVNPIDWTVLSYIEMQDSLVWSSRSIPVGTDNPIDVATMQFKIPIWINPPAKIKKQSIIHQIVTNIIQGQKDTSDMAWSDYELFARHITTPGNATIKVTPLSNGTFSFSLCDESLSNKDEENLPTITFSSQNPQLDFSLRFLWNGITCTIDTNDISQAVLQIKEQIKGTDLNCVVFNDNTIQFINMSGGNNEFKDIIPESLAALGLKETIYPGGTLAWWRLLQLYGSVKSYDSYGSAGSQIRLKTVEDIDQTNTDIIGWFNFDPIDQNKVIWTPDSQSYPATSLEPIDAIINPQNSGPNINLPQAAVGQRYLITEDATETSVAWGTMTAKANDIIEFDGSSWKTVWSADSNSEGIEHVFNNRSNRTYKWFNGYWASVIESKYLQGYWRLSL